MQIVETHSHLNGYDPIWWSILAPMSKSITSTEMAAQIDEVGWPTPPVQSATGTVRWARHRAWWMDTTEYFANIDGVTFQIGVSARDTYNTDWYVSAVLGDRSVSLRALYGRRILTSSLADAKEWATAHAAEIKTKSEEASR